MLEKNAATESQFGRLAAFCRDLAIQGIQVTVMLSV
jgi:hypothetical protein